MATTGSEFLLRFPQLPRPVSRQVPNQEHARRPGAYAARDKKGNGLPTDIEPCCLVKGKKVSRYCSVVATKENPPFQPV
jgi:hypothetical protein